MPYQLSYRRLADQLNEQQADKHQAATRGEEAHRQRHADTKGAGTKHRAERAAGRTKQIGARERNTGATQTGETKKENTAKQLKTRETKEEDKAKQPKTGETKKEDERSSQKREKKHGQEKRAKSGGAGRKTKNWGDNHGGAAGASTEARGQEGESHEKTDRGAPNKEIKRIKAGGGAGTTQDAE